MGLLARWRARRAPAPVVLDPDDPSLVVVVEAYDAARADSSVLAEAAGRGVALDGPVLLRHHLLGLPDAAAVARAAESLAGAGYATERAPAGEVVTRDPWGTQLRLRAAAPDPTASSTEHHA